MKQVIGTVVREVDLRAVDPRSELARKSAIAFMPHRHALVVAAGALAAMLPLPCLGRCQALDG